MKCAIFNFLVILSSSEATNMIFFSPGKRLEDVFEGKKWKQRILRTISDLLALKVVFQMTKRRWKMCKTSIAL